MNAICFEVISTYIYTDLLSYRYSRGVAPFKIIN
jgi:hypothetical protein